MPQESVDMVTAVNFYILQAIVDTARKGGITEAELAFGIGRDLVEKLYFLDPPSLHEIACRQTFLFSVNEETIRNEMMDRYEGQGYRSMHQVIASVSAMTREKVRVK